MRRLAIGVFMLFCGTVQAGGDNLPVGARFAGMGYAGLTLVDVWSIHHNQAGLAGLERPVAGLYYQQHFLSAELGHQGLAFAMPLGNGTIGVTANSFGYSLYRETKAGLTYAMRFGEGLRAGIQLDYMHVALGEGYGSTGSVTAELGVQARITEKLWLGVHLFNPNRAELGGPYNDRIPTVLRAGLGYTFSEKLRMTGEVEKDIDRAERFRAGLEYRPIEVLYLRTGVSTGDVQGHFGVGLHFGPVDVDMAMSWRAQLGATPQVNLNYTF
ncbi:MAG: hypothetical protein KDB88_12540 [Flavobacteriales bacterium]|nr:hypothetical protein [Flavobacteriales bacterium]